MRGNGLFIFARGLKTAMALVQDRRGLSRSAHLVAIGNGFPLVFMIFALSLLALMASPAQAAQRGGAVACTREYAPVCADVRQPCFIKPCKLRRKTFANACLARAAGARIVYIGRCRAGDVGREMEESRARHFNPREPEKDPNCKSWTDGCNICRRKRPGGEAQCSDGPCGKVAPRRCLTYFDERDKCR